MSSAPIQIDINAPTSLVWEVLTDLESYPRWNPMTPKVVGTLVEGATLKLTARVGRMLRTQDQRVYELVPERRLVWSGAAGPELVRGIRTQTVESLPDNRTRYTTIDEFYGPLARFTERRYGDDLRAGFHAVAAALKQESERRMGIRPERPPIPIEIPEEGYRLPHRASWYAAVQSADLPAGTVRQATVCGRDLVIWRTQAGQLGAARNVCGHLAASLAPGATVNGETLVCPHHRTGFGVSGRACGGRARDLATVPVREVGPVVMVWHHPHGAPPSFELPVLDEDGWGHWRVQALELPVHPQHVMQDLADLSHFETVHRYSAIKPRMPTTADGPRLMFAADFGWDSGVELLPPIPMRFHSTSHGLGFQITEVQDAAGILASRHLLMPSPIDDHTTRLILAVETRLGQRSRQWSAAVQPMCNAILGRYIHAHFRRDVLRDASLWIRRVHLPGHTPPDDDAHATFARWLGQFET